MGGLMACNKQPPPDHPLHGSGTACHMHENHEGGCTWALEPSPARRGIDRLLAAMPVREIESIDSQPEREILVRVIGNQEIESLGAEPAGPWVLVKFVGDRQPYAIWKETGAVYRIGPDAVVDDDPLIPADD